MRDATRLSMFVATEEAFFLWYGTVQCVWVNDSPKLMEAVTATVPAEKFCKLLPIWVSAKCAGIGLPGCVVCIESPYQYSSDCSSSRLLRASLVLSGIYNL